VSEAEDSDASEVAHIFYSPSPNDIFNGSVVSWQVAHDWGGLVAWVFVETHPELVTKLIQLNIPPRQSLERPFGAAT
jgi:hypothetical protein